MTRVSEVSSAAVVCPHCKFHHIDDLPEWATNAAPKRATCDMCGKSFEHWADVSVTYYSQAASVTVDKINQQR